MDLEIKISSLYFLNFKGWTLWIICTGEYILTFPTPWGGGIQPRNEKFRKKRVKKREKIRKRKKREKWGKKGRKEKKNYVKRRRNILSLNFMSLGKKVQIYSFPFISEWWYFPQLLKRRKKITISPKILTIFSHCLYGEEKTDILEKFHIFPLYWELSLISQLYFKF